MSAVSRIGVEKESALHAALKFRYAGIDGSVEKAVGQYVCDAIQSNGTIVEIQTGSFGSIKNKIEKIAETSPVRIVHPIAVERHIELRDISGALLRCRRSPKKGSPWDLFNALVYAPRFPLIDNLTIELAMIAEIEHRKDDGRGSWRRKRISISDRELREVITTIVLSKPNDYRRFVPFSKSQVFGVHELASTAAITPGLARKALYVLSRINIIEEKKKKGNAKQYQLV